MLSCFGAFSIYINKGGLHVKKVVFVFLAIIFITLLIPLAVVYLLGANPASDARGVKLYLADEGRTIEIDEDDYIKCVVAAEMPADFEPEALKAQSVAARTFLLSRVKAWEDGTQTDHPDAPVCTDSTHCQAYIPEDKRRESWGGSSDANWDKISSAVEATRGEVITYNGEIISALFHSASASATENAADVWGSDIPYLKSVPTRGDEAAPSFYSSVTVSADEFKRAVEDRVAGTDWTKGLYGNIARSAAGGIISLDLGGVNVRGTLLRSIFSLRSTNVEFEEHSSDVTMNVKGYGHGVGMSQYGANYLASQGETYDAILKKYYTGVEIEHR